ncbi:DMT family transporter [Thauera mechernichensis]|uniref:DMT family transporter n=1 Tax=Thauera mechernichensis TaxID=82788 RepID=A0ABW3WD62_9RHOO|nr:DMT family transporter [Thauera mechernichensis]HAY11545.1 EamA family transporter [Thauera sp.]MDG3065691.1 DMT family transporter [Thauera mechernichensis]HNR60644.1 DMT family transporter [Thauera sp.]HNS92288.1 DMT family transporter [Thauera sp.]HRJ24933.1 DMT family transporter [Thauera sp.]
MPVPTQLTRLMPLLFVVLWSTGFIGAKYGLPYAEPLTFLAVRYVLVIGLMTLLALAMRAPWPASPRDAMHIAVTGLLVHAVYLGGVFMSIHHGLPAGISALVVGMQPLLTGALAGALLGERVSSRQWAGLALGFAGVALVVGSKVSVDGVATDALGRMLLPALAALVGITAGTLYQKRFCPRFDLRTGSVLQFLPSLALTALVASQVETMQIDWSGEFVFALLWLVLVLSLGAISLLNLLIRSGSAVNVASLFYLTPPTTALIAWAMFGETLSPLALAGMAIAVSGVWLARKG